MNWSKLSPVKWLDLVGASVVLLLLNLFVLYITTGDYSSRPVPLVAILLGALLILFAVLQTFFLYDDVSGSHRHYRGNLRFSLAIYAISLVVMVANLVWVYHYLTDKGEWQGYITRIHWEYQVHVDQWVADSDNCWGNWCPPANAYNESRQWRDTGRNRKTGEVCTTVNDVKSCTPIYEDVYDWYYSYTVNRWVRNRTVVERGDGQEPFYPDPNITRLYGDEETCPNGNDAHGRGASRLGCERVAGRTPYHYYNVQVAYPDDVIEGRPRCSTNRDDWMALFIEETISGLYFLHQRRIDCSETRFLPLSAWQNE